MQSTTSFLSWRRFQMMVHQQNRCAINNGIIEVLGLASDGRPDSAATLSIPDLQAHYLDSSRWP